MRRTWRGSAAGSAARGLAPTRWLRARRRASLLAVVLGLGCALAIGLEANGLLQRLELDTVDVRFSIRGARRPPADLVVVGIDATTLSEIGKRFPYPRSLQARMIDRLTADSARVIAYDIEFLDRTNAHDDGALLTAIARSGRVVLASSQVDAQGRPQVIGGAAQLHRLGGDIAIDSAWIEDPGGEVRRMRTSVGRNPSLAMEVASRVQHRPPSLPGRSDRGAWIDYYGPRGTFRSYPFSQVLRGRVPIRALRGKIVVVGATDPALHDLHPAPPSGELMAGPEIQANAIATALRGFPLRSVPREVDYAISIGLSLAIVALALAWSGLAALAAMPIVLLMYALVTQLAFDGGSVLGVVYQAAGLGICGLGSAAVDYLTEVRERRRMRGLFARFVPEHVVDDVLRRTDDDLRLGGVALEASALFCDLRGFTSFAEAAQAERVIEVLNRYLTEVSEAIRAHGGTLVAYLGDGVLAVFGAPIEARDHADRALAAGREILERRLPALNRWLATIGEQGVTIGIGIASGQVMSGNVGAPWRLEYAAVGDPTNVAARLQEATKTYGYPLLVAEATRSRLTRSHELIALGTLELRGRAEAVTTWAFDPRSAAPSD